MCGSVNNTRLARFPSPDTNTHFPPLVPKIESINKCDPTSASCMLAMGPCVSPAPLVSGCFDAASPSVVSLCFKVAPRHRRFIARLMLGYDLAADIDQCALTLPIAFLTRPN